MNTDLKSRIGTLAFNECNKFVQLSLLDTISKFLESFKNGDRKTGDISREDIESFLMGDFEPSLSKPKTNSTPAKYTWLGYRREYKNSHPDAKPDEIGEAWALVRDNLDDKERDRLIKVGRSKAEKTKRPGTKSAWIGFRQEFAAMNAALEDDDKNKLSGRDINKAASVAWNKGDGITDEKIAFYQKLAAENKIANEKKEAKKSKAKKPKDNKKVKKSKEDEPSTEDSSSSEEEEQESKNSSDSDSEDEKITKKTKKN